MKATLSPYLTFNGNTAEAMKFYQSVLGGKLFLQTFDEVGMADSPELKDKIIHSHLDNDTLSFMASDTPPGISVQFGDNTHMCIAGSDEKKLREYFDKLTKGGKVNMPLEKQFWGDIFGMFTDKFGVHWMVNISAKKT